MTTIEERFEHPILTKIIGPLTYRQLKTIKDELKANAASIYSELGGGAHGYLGLVLTMLEYANVSATMFIRHIENSLTYINRGSVLADRNSQGKIVPI